MITAALVAPAFAENPAAESDDEAPLMAEASIPVIGAIAPVESSRKEAKPWKPEISILDGPVKMKYSRKGLEVQSRSGNYKARVRWRTQLRFSHPFRSDPRTPADFEKPVSNELGFQRARLKADGNVFGSWLDYSFEHDLISNRVLNLYATAKVKDCLQFRGGQWKPEFTRERRTSSAKQQFVDRSIVNRAFTVDRQTGFAVLGNLMKGTRGDSWYYAGVFTGTGRGGWLEDGGHPMYLLRYQWNFLGQDIGFSSSDLEYHDSPAASVALSGVTNRSRYTRFSSSGGGYLDDFEIGSPGQFSIKQANAEFTMKYRGLSIQNENHWKNIHDNVNIATTDMRGTYAQAGYFPHWAMEWVPSRLEVGYRYAYVDPNVLISGDLQQEHTVVVNWFFEGHSNKLSFDVGRVSLTEAGKPGLSAMRYRMQWDIHF